MNKAALRQIEQTVGYEFSDKALLVRAFTHSSAVDNRLESNERLEFLGDAVLALVICQTLFERFSDYLEGDLTKIKSRLVNVIGITSIREKLFFDILFLQTRTN